MAWRTSVLVLIAMLASPASHAERRILFIANSDYVHAPRLTGPKADVELLSSVMRAKPLGFRVDVTSNRNLEQMLGDVQAFAASLKPDDLAVIYYAGHGLRADGTNYLLPVDANPRTVEELKIKALDVRSIRNLLAPSPSAARVLVLDACRNNPFSLDGRAASRGLARMGASVGNLLIAYSANEGEVADDGGGGASVYAKSLAESLKMPGLNVVDIFMETNAKVSASTDSRQNPIIEVTSFLRIVFNGGSAQPPVVDPNRRPAPAPTPPPAPCSDREFPQVRERARCVAETFFRLLDEQKIDEAYLNLTNEGYRKNVNLSFFRGATMSYQLQRGSLPETRFCSVNPPNGDQVRFVTCVVQAAGRSWEESAWVRQESDGSLRVAMFSQSATQVFK